jgi:hypothetical protein
LIYFGQGPSTGCTLCTRSSGIGAATPALVALVGAAAARVCPGTTVPTICTRWPDHEPMSAPDRRYPFIAVVVPAPAATLPGSTAPGVAVATLPAASAPTAFEGVPVALAGFDPTPAVPAVPTPVAAVPAVPTPVAAVPAVPTPVAAVPGVPIGDPAFGCAAGGGVDAGVPACAVAVAADGGTTSGFDSMKPPCGPAMLPTQPISVTVFAAFLDEDAAGRCAGEVCADAERAQSRAIPLRSVTVFMLPRAASDRPPLRR